MILTGKNAIISGASQGLGFEIAKHFIIAGANVMLCARSSTELNQAQKKLSLFASDKTKIHVHITDIANHKQVMELTHLTYELFGKIDILVANAGIYGTKGPIEKIDWQEWSDAIDINLKGTVWQCQAVVPYFKKQKSGKILILSGGGATKPMPYLSAYAASKAGVVRFAETLAEELKEFNIDINTIAPGALNTRLLDDILEAGKEKVGEIMYEQALKQKSTGGTPLNLGAELCAFLASSASDGITGKLISAAWDPWKQLPELKEKLQNSDIYTLRRIVPKDRGEDWDHLL